MITCIENTDVGCIVGFKDCSINEAKVKYGLDGILKLRKNYITFEEACDIDKEVFIENMHSLDYLKPFHPYSVRHHKLPSLAGLFSRFNFYEYDEQEENSTLVLDLTYWSMEYFVDFSKIFTGLKCAVLDLRGSNLIQNTY